MPIDFICHRKNSDGAELASAEAFLGEFCTLVDVPQPEPTGADKSHNTYIFEKSVDFNNGDGTTGPGRIDLHRRGCLVLESKQGVKCKAAGQAVMLATKTKQEKIHEGMNDNG